MLREHVLRRGLVKEVVIAKKDRDAKRFWCVGRVGLAFFAPLERVEFPAANDESIKPPSALIKYDKFRYIRENLSESLRRCGFTYKYDISLPIDLMYTLVDQTRARVQGFPDARVVGCACDGQHRRSVSERMHSRPSC